MVNLFNKRTEQSKKMNVNQNASDTDVNSDTYSDMNQNASDTDVNSDTYSDIGENSGTALQCKLMKYKENKRLFEFSDNSGDEVDGLMNLENRGSLKQRILGHKSQNPKRFKQEINHNKVYRTSPIILTDSSNDSVTNSEINRLSIQRNEISSLTVRDNRSDNSDDEIQLIEQESLFSLIKKSSQSINISDSDRISFDHVTAVSSCVDSQTSVDILVNGSQTSIENSENEGDKGVSKKVKRSKEEVEERKRQAQKLKADKEKERLQKKLEREEKLALKERDKQMKNVERERKRQFGLNSLCVILDPHIVNDCGLGAAIFSVCEKLGVSCLTEEQRIPYTVSWRRTITECNVNENQLEKIEKEISEDEVISVLPVCDFVEMVHTFKERQLGNYCEGKTLRDYVQAVQSHLVGKVFTMVVIGMEKYFRDQKTTANRQHREAVMATGLVEPSKNKKQKKKEAFLIVSRVDVEEAVTDTQLQTCSMVYMMETGEDFAEFVRTYTKAVAEKPAKKDRLNSVFSFHEEGTSGVKVDKCGHGLLKVWKQQLLQFKNISPDVAEALIAVYPSPWLLKEAYKKCTSEKEAIKLLENVVVRRGAGILETTRRVGKELSRRIYTSMTCTDPCLVIK